MDDSTITSQKISNAGSINFTGLGSGTDFNSMITKLIEAEVQQRIKPLQSWKEDWNNKIEAFQELNSSMLSLDTTLQGMDTMEEFLIKNANSNDEAVLTASASSSAQVASHTIEINQLAQNEISTANTSETSKDAIINNSGAAQQFDYTYAGTSVSLEVADGTTLEDFKNMINNDPDNPGIRANIIKEGTDDYHLQIRGMDLGAANTFSIDGTTTLTNYQETDFTDTQAAQDSQIRVDGYPSGDWIERSTNSISDVIEGLTLNLQSTGTANVDVSTNKEAIKEQVRTFVEKTNEVLSLFKESMKFDETSGEGSLLTGNYGTQIVQQKLKSILASKGIGFSYENDNFPALSTIGIKTDHNEGSDTFGQLLLDEAKLDEALTKDAQGVAELFGADFVGESESTNLRYHSHVSDITKGGTYDVTYSVDGGSQTITSATINGHEAKIDGDLIVGKSGYPESGLAIKVNDLTTTVTDATGTVDLKQGKADELASTLSELTNSSSGPLNIIKDNYTDIVDNINKKIEDEHARISRMERDLRTKFAKLESLLGRYDQMQSQLDSQLKQLSG
jgi:flagellar hook-associated protein 2